MLTSKLHLFVFWFCFFFLNNPWYLDKSFSTADLLTHIPTPFPYHHVFRTFLTRSDCFYCFSETLRHNDQGRVQQTLTQPSPACATEAAGPRKINKYIFINLNLKKINKKMHSCAMTTLMLRRKISSPGLRPSGQKQHRGESEQRTTRLSDSILII